MKTRQHAREKRGRTSRKPRRRLSVWAVGAVGLVSAALLVSACGSSSTPQAAPATSSSVALHSFRLPSGEQVLANGSGQALYMFVPDDQKTVTCGPVCLRSWPLVTVPAGERPKVGPGVESKLVGTLKANVLESGDKAVTYNRWPLYTYADDVSPGMTNGQGTDLNGGYWYLMQTDGTPLVPPGDPAA